MHRYFFVFLLFATHLQAQTPDSLPNTQLQDVVVTAARKPESLRRTPEKVLVLSALAMRQSQARTLPEALNQLNGVFVQKTNHGGGSPFLRGHTGNQTLTIMDGIRLNNATYRYGPNQYLNTFDLFSTEKVEVMYGAGSTQYGSDAFGGVIALYSDLPKLSDRIRPMGQVMGRWVNGGMENSARAEAGISGKKAAIVGGYSARRFGDLIGGDTTGRQVPTGYNENAWDVRARWNPTTNWEITAVHRHLAQSDVPVFHKIQLENFAVNAFEPQKRNISWLKNEWKPQGNLLQSVSLTLSRQFSEEGRVSRKNGSNILRTETDSVRTLAAIVQSNWTLIPRGTTSLGAEIYQDRVFSHREDRDITTQQTVQKRGLYPNDATMQNWALFLLQNYQLRTWTFTAGARYNGYSIQVNDADNGAVDLRPAALVGSLGVVKKMGQHHYLTANANSSFRAPNIDDLGTLGIVDFRYEVPNYDLKPEKALNTQLGYRYTGTAISGELTVFRQELRDLITRTRRGLDSLQGYPVYVKENTEKAYIQGTEATLNWAFHRLMRWENAVTYTFGQNVTRNEPWRRVPPVFGRSAMVFTNKGWFASLELRFAGDQTRLAQGDKDDNRIPKGGTPGWAVLNTYAGWSGRHWSVQLAGINLNNADYRYHGSGVNGQGRSVSCSVIWAFHHN